MLKAESVVFSVDGRQLLAGVNVEVKPGTVTAVIGPNGSGKTSLIKLLSGEWQPETGQVVLQHQPITQWVAEQRAQMLAVLPQQSTLSFPFTVQEVVMLGRYPHSSGQQKDSDIVEQTLAAVDVSHLKLRRYTTLSGGEKQRVNLARVLAQIWEGSTFGERFLLLDEPTSALDLAHQHLILSLARKMADAGVGVLVVLHDLNLAAQYADQLVLLSDGNVVACGDAEGVLTSAHIQKVFNIAVSVLTHPSTGKPLLVHG